MEGQRATGPQSVADGIIEELIGWASDRPAGRARVLVLTGPAGAGKTYAAARALAACAESGMLTAAGKFAEGQAGGTFAPIMAALSGLVAAAMRTLFDRQKGLASLTAALGVQLDVLIAAGFELTDVAPVRAIEALANRRGSAARITTAVLALLDWLTRFGAPRVLLIDDWYRAGAEARQLLAAIAAAPAAAPLMLVLTQRASADIGAPTVPFDRIEALGALQPVEIRRLLDERLGAEAGGLAAAVLSSVDVAPLPFDVLQAADALVETGVLRRVGERWEIEAARVRSLALDAAARVAGLDEGTFEVALSLALWGDRAPIEAFGAAFADQPGVSAALHLLAARDIVAQRGGHVAFRHDRLRRETLARGAGERSRAAAARLAEGLRAAGADDDEAAALHLRLAGGLAEADVRRWRDRFARGATAARNRGDSASADAFAEAALELDSRAPTQDSSARRLILREALIAAANRDDPATDARARALIATARSPTEVYADHEIGIVGLRLAGRGEEAWALASEGLRRAGLRPPPARPWLRALVAALRWRYAPRGRGGFEPGEETDAFTGMAAAAAHLAYHRDPRGTAIIGFDASRRSGRTFRHSSYWRSVDAFLFAAMKNRRGAFEAATQAVDGADGQRTYRGATLYQATFFGLHWGNPIPVDRPRYLAIVAIAGLEGDLVTAAYAWRLHIMSGWRCGVPLMQLCDEAIVARRALIDLGEESFTAEMDATVALLEELSGRTEWTGAAWRTDIPTRNHVIDLELSNLAADWEGTVRCAEALRPLWADYAIQSDSVTWAFHETLARLKTGRRPRRGALALLREAAALNAGEHLGKLRLIEALRTKATRPGAVREAFEEAVQAAGSCASRLDAGLACLCAAEAMADGGDANAAEEFRQGADSIWRVWGLPENRRPRPAFVIARDRLVELEARAEAAERADRAKARLIAHVGHELRTPLQALQAAIDLSIQTDEPIDLGDVRLVLGGLTRVVEDLDVIGGLADGRDLVSEAIDIAALVRSEAALLRGHPVAVVGATPIWARVAADRLRQVVRNLLSNAVKYGGGSAVEVMLAGERAGDRVAVEIAVADRGPGVPEELREAIFRPFERGDRTGDGRGAGLGLALSRQVAERLGGALDVTARPGGGAVFTLRLSLPAGDVAVAITAPRAVRCRDILLIEDAAPVRRLLATMLTASGYRAREAADAGSGLAAWREERPDLTIVDLGLPDASGLDVLAAIRRESAEAAVIVLSAAITPEAADVVAADPRARPLRKPASAQSLEAAIGDLFGRGPALIETADDPLYATARAEVRAQARALVGNHEAANPQALHRLAGTAAQFGWLPVAAAVEGFAAALASGRGAEPAGAGVLAAVEEMR